MIHLSGLNVMLFWTQRNKE